jgi:GNAT superfamily N-acetyltransferase
MLQIKPLVSGNRSDLKLFVEYPFHLYAQVPQWVPPVRADVRMMLNAKKHPFYDHSDAQAYLAYREGQVVGRIAVLENRLFNQVQNKKIASFALLDCEENPETLQALVNAAIEWAKPRGLEMLVGPKPFGLGEGYGILVEGFEIRQMMTMMNYNLPYLPRMLEEIGFTKEVDFVSCQIEIEKFSLPEKVRRVAERVLEKGTISVRSFRTRADIRAMGKDIGHVYNEVFINNWEYYPYTQREIDVAIENIILFADPGLIKILMDGDRTIGFLLAFPDISPVLQRHQGRLNPFSIVDLMRGMKRADMVTVNGMGVLSEYYGRGGNALLYYEMEKTVKSRGFKFAEFTQVAESAQQMRRDLITLGGAEVKNHRVYHMPIK